MKNLIASQLTLVFVAGILMNQVSPLFGQVKNDTLIIGDENIVPGKANGKDYLLGSVISVVADNAGNVYAVDNRLKLVKKYSREGVFITDIGGVGKGPGEYISPRMIKTDGDKFIYLLSGQIIIKYNLSGQFILQYDLSTIPGLDYTIVDFETLSENRVIVHSISTHSQDRPVMFFEVDLKDGLIRSFGNYVSYDSDASAKRIVDKYQGNKINLNTTFFRGYISIIPKSTEIFFISMIYPSEIRSFDIGKDEPKNLFSDKSFHPEFTVKPLTDNRGVYKISLDDQEYALTVSHTTLHPVSIVGSTIYFCVYNWKDDETILKGYSIQTGQCVFNEEIILKTPVGTTSRGLRFIDKDLNGYFAVNEPYAHIVRIKLVNGGSINLKGSLRSLSPLTSGYHQPSIGMNPP